MISTQKLEKSNACAKDLLGLGVGVKEGVHLLRCKGRLKQAACHDAPGGFAHETLEYLAEGHEKVLFRNGGRHTGQASDGHEAESSAGCLGRAYAAPHRRANAASIDPARNRCTLRPYPKVWLTQPWRRSLRLLPEEAHYSLNLVYFPDRHGIWGEVWSELWTAAARRCFLSLHGRSVTLLLLSLCWQQPKGKKESGVEPPQSKALAADDPPHKP